MALLARRGLRIAGWISGGLLLVVILALVMAHTPPVRRYAQRQATEILRRQGIDFNATDLNYNLLDLSASLNDVVVRSPQRPDMPPILQADRVEVDLSLRKLITGDISIEDATVRNPRVHLVVDAMGQDNIPRNPSPSPDQGGSTSFFIDHFLISGGSLQYEDQRQMLNLQVPLERVEIDGNPATGTHEIALATQPNGSATFQERMVAIGRIQAEAELGEDMNAIDIANATLNAADSQLTVSGRVDMFDNPNFDLSGNTSLALGALARLGGVSQPAEGTVNATWTLNGPLAQLTATARLEGEDLTLDRFRGVDLQAEAGYSAASSRVRLDSLNVNSPLGTVQGRASVALNTAAGASTANIAARGLDLAALMTALGQDVRVASRATADIDANWPGLEFARAAGNASIQLTPTREAPAENVVPVSARLNAQTRGNRTVVGITELSAMGAEAMGQVVLVNQQALDGEVQLTAADIADAVSQAEAFLGRAPGSLLGTPVSGRTTITANLDGTLNSPRVQANVAAPALQAGALKEISVQADALYTPERVQLDMLSVGWLNQTITAMGTVGLQGEQPLNLQAQAQNIAIAQVLAGLNRQDVPADGTVSFDANVTGTTSAPQAQFQLTGTGLQAYRETFGDLTARGNLNGRVATIEQLQLQKPQDGADGSLQATGTYNLDTRGYTVDLNADNFSLTNFALPNGTPVRVEDASLTAMGQGTVDNPALTVKGNIDAVRYQDKDLGTVELNATVANQQAQASFAMPMFSLEADAQVGTVAPYPTTFKLTANNTQLESLPLPPNVPVTGSVTATIQGSGEIDNYQQGQASAEIASANLQWQGQPIQTDGPLRASYANEVLTIDQATITASQSRVSLSGTLPLTEQAGSGTVQLMANLDLPTLAPYLPVPQPVMAGGTATIEGAVTGNLKRIEPQLSIALTNGSYSAAQLNAPITNAQLQAQVANGALQLEMASAQYGPATITANGTVPFGLLPELPVELPRQQGPAEFHAQLQQLDLASLGALPSTVTGTVSAQLDATAPNADINSLNAELTLPELRVAIGNYAISQQAPSRIVVRNGTATVEQFALGGPLTDIRLTGTAGITGEYPLDLQLNGNADAAIASAFTDSVNASGGITIQAAVTGTASNPAAQGFLELQNGQVAMSNPLVAAENLNARLELAGQQVELTRLNGSLNGGMLTGSGTLGYQNDRLANTNLMIAAKGVYLDFPEGMKTISDIDLTLASAGETATLGGQVTIREGGFTDDLNLDRGILAALTAPSSIDLTEERNPLLDNLRFNINVDTATPIVVDNNLAQIELTSDLRVVGTPYEPGLSGRLVIAENGQIRLQEREYQVERGIITFNNERRIEPELDVIANTTVGGYDVRLQVSGAPGDTDTTITSNPSLPEPDILALLITGKRRDQLEGEEINVARDQVLSYLAGRVGTTLGRGIESATGLSTVRIEPNLIAAEADPSARLTVGQDITRNLELIYSMDLVNSSDQIYVANYEITKRFTTRGVRQSDGSYRFDFRHDVRFGGMPEPRRDSQTNQLRIGNVNLTGNPGFAEMRVLDKAKLKAGDEYDFFKARKGADRVTDLYLDENFLEAKIRLNRDQQNGTVDLNLNVERGPKVNLVFEGASVPGGVRERVREIWFTGVFDTQRAEDAKAALEEWLVGDDHLQPEIRYMITNVDAETKRVVFDITPGPKFHDVQWDFEGAAGESPETLREIIKDQELTKEIYTKPGRVTELLTRYYQEMGYLDAEIADPAYELNAATRTGRVVFPVSEGPLYRIGTVEFEGNEAISDARLNAQVPFPVGEAFRPVLRNNAEVRLKALYWQEGFNDVSARFITQRERAAGVVNVRFQIEEGERSVVREVVVEGNDATSEGLVRSQLVIGPGDPLSLEQVGASRRALYSTGAYSLVDIINEPIAGATEPDGTKAVRLHVQVREIQPYELLYGAFFDTERGAGGIVDMSNRNSLGSARVLGMRARYDGQLREARLYFSQPLLRRFPLRTIASPYLRQERNPATSDTDPFNVDRIGFSVQQEARLRQSFLWNYGYRIERSRTFDPSPEALFDVPLRVASLTSTLSRETRDEILDATRGSFMSHAVQFSPTALGSELSFIKYFGQYFRYFPLQKPRIELFTNQVVRPRLVYATGLRVGLARGFAGQEVPLAERFFAGGATTIRGFEQNTVGPVLGRQPSGGEAMLVLNNELRFPIISIFDGVGFVDVGGVYPRVTGINLRDLRETAGAGLRVRTPWFLLRLDYGLKLDRRDGEPAGRLFFSIGQAF